MLAVIAEVLINHKSLWSHHVVSDPRRRVVILRPMTLVLEESVMWQESVHAEYGFTGG